MVGHNCGQVVQHVLDGVVLVELFGELSLVVEKILHQVVGGLGVGVPVHILHC